METRFIESGKRLCEKHNLKLTEENINWLAKWSFNYFCADCSDDYSVTLREQAALNKSLQTWLDSK